MPLAELYEGCRIAIEKKGGEVILRSPVRSLHFENGSLKGAIFDGGREESADSFILALPQDRTAELLPKERIDLLRNVDYPIKKLIEP